MEKISFINSEYLSDNETISERRNLWSNQPIGKSCICNPSNLAEGCVRNSSAELRRFATISMGSASELEYLLQLSHDLGLVNHEQYESLNSEQTEIKRMLVSFIQTL